MKSWLVLLYMALICSFMLQGNSELLLVWLVLIVSAVLFFVYEELIKGKK